MQIVSFRLLTADFSAALHFWNEQLGLPISYSDPKMGYAYITIGEQIGMEIMLRSEHDQVLNLPPTQTCSHNTVITVRVDNVEATYNKLLQAGITALSQPADRPAWNAHTAHFQAPDGYILEIYTPLGK